MTRPTMSDINLKCCPFCGGKAIQVSGLYYEDIRAFVFCADCLAEGEHHIDKDWLKANNRAAASWNRRTP
jgi:Lar family restriction alleviation protein